MERQYYSFKEAVRKIKYTVEDLCHFVETEQLHPTLYTKQRRFILTTGDTDLGAWDRTGGREYCLSKL